MDFFVVPTASLKVLFVLVVLALLLAATQGTELEIECVGDDAEACAQALRELIKAGFNED